MCGADHRCVIFIVAAVKVGKVFYEKEPQSFENKWYFPKERRGRNQAETGMGKEVCGGKEEDGISGSSAADILSPFPALIHLPESYWTYLSNVAGTGPKRAIRAVESCLGAR